jgi:hypothetical protein
VNAIADRRLHGGETRCHAVASVAAALLCAAAGLTTVYAAGTGPAACQDGVFEQCLNGRPSFELVFQTVLAAAAFAATLAMRIFLKRRSYALAGATLAVTVLLFVGWALLLDATLHG